jgi:hypothetical protein
MVENTKKKGILYRILYALSIEDDQEVDYRHLRKLVDCAEHWRIEKELQLEKDALNMLEGHLKRVYYVLDPTILKK